MYCRLIQKENKSSNSWKCGYQIVSQIWWKIKLKSSVKCSLQHSLLKRVRTLPVSMRTGPVPLQHMHVKCVCDVSTQVPMRTVHTVDARRWCHTVDTRRCCAVSSAIAVCLTVLRQGLWGNWNLVFSAELAEQESPEICLSPSSLPG